MSDECERIAAEVVKRVLSAMVAGQESMDEPVREQITPHPGVLQVECVRAGWRARGEKDADVLAGVPCNCDPGPDEQHSIMCPCYYTELFAAAIKAVDEK